MKRETPISVLYIEDDQALARLCQRKLEQAGYVVDLAFDGATGAARCEQGTYDVLAVDQHMPGQNGLEVIQYLASNGALPPTIMITGAGDEKMAVQAMKAGARDYIFKDLAGGYLALLPDMIEQVLNQQLIQAKEEAEAALLSSKTERKASNEDLNASARTLAQDLQNPLASMLECAALMALDLESMSPADCKKHLDDIIRSGEKMQEIIDETF